MTRVRLGDIATARAGDKGDTSNICVFIDRPDHFAAVKQQLTGDRIKAAFPRLLRGPVVRYCIPHLGAINFVITNGLEGGVNTSLNLDAHGKSFSFLLLDLEIELEEIEAYADTKWSKGSAQ
jgi:hypothetical protein